MSETKPRLWPDWPESDSNDWDEIYKDVPRERLVELVATGRHNETYWMEKYKDLLAKKTFPKMDKLISALEELLELAQEISDYHREPND